jgi:hypothetical protein
VAEELTPYDPITDVEEVADLALTHTLINQGLQSLDRELLPRVTC